MPAQRKTNQSRGLTAAGLIAVTAATLLMMAWAILPGPAFADGTFTWGHNGFPNATCTAATTPKTMLWVFNDNGTAVPTSLTINGVVQSGSWVPSGGGFKFTVTVTATNYPPSSASVTYTGTLGKSTVLTLSHCDGSTTTTPTTTTTTPGGGGGGGTTTAPPPAPTTTTTTTPIVAPTTVHNTSTAPAAEVLPTTVRPGKLAFTGIEDVVPIGALALTLMTTGSGLLWAGSRRRRHDGSEDED
jgi:hypothetical protein